MNIVASVTGLRESDDYISADSVKDYIESPSTAGQTPPAFHRAVSTIGGFLKSHMSASPVATWSVEPGDQPPRLSGKRGGHYTLGGTPVRYPNAYARKGWSNLKYVTNSQHITVGLNWLRRQLPKETEIFVTWQDETSSVSMRDFEQGIEKDNEPYNRDDPLLGENNPVYLNRMSRAKRLIEYMCPAPAVEPKPGVKPAAPGRPAPKPAPRPSQNPFRRRDIRPGEEPRPKARGAMESLQEAKKKGLKQPSQGGKAPHAFSKAKKIISKSSGTGASGTSAKKAFKK